jgi:hypothetical protein
MPIGFIAVMFGSLLMRVPGSVAGQHGRLLVCGGGLTVGPPRLDVALCGGMVSDLGAFKRLFGAPLSLLYGEFGRPLAVSQIGPPLLQLQSASTGPVPAATGGFAVVVRRRLSVHGWLQ